MRDYLATLPPTVATRVFGGYALLGLDRFNQREIDFYTALFDASLCLLQAQIHAQQFSPLIRLDSGWFIPPFNQKVDYAQQLEFAYSASHAYQAGYQQAREIIPTEIQHQIRSIYPIWLASSLGLTEYADLNAIIDLLQHPQPVFMPDDFPNNSRNNFLKKAKFSYTGGVLNWPKFFRRLRFLRYMHAQDFPPTVWYSDRPENDLLSFATQQASESNLSVSDIVTGLGCHEATHGMAINPVLEITLAQSPHCWLAEGIATYYGDWQRHSLMLGKISSPLAITEITGASDKPVDYNASLLLIMALATKLGQGSIDEGITYIVTKLADLALAINQGQAEKIASPLELLYFLDPKLRDQTAQDELAELMGKIRDRALANN